MQLIKINQQKKDSLQCSSTYHQFVSCSTNEAGWSADSVAIFNRRLYFCARDQFVSSLLLLPYSSIPTYIYTYILYLYISRTTSFVFCSKLFVRAASLGWCLFSLLYFYISLVCCSFPAVMEETFTNYATLYVGSRSNNFSTSWISFVRSSSFIQHGAWCFPFHQPPPTFFDPQNPTSASPVSPNYPNMFVS